MPLRETKRHLAHLLRRQRQCHFDHRFRKAPTAVIGICGRIVPEHAEFQPTSFEYLLRDRNRLTNLPDSIEDLSRHAEPWSAIE